MTVALMNAHCESVLAGHAMGASFCREAVTMRQRHKEDRNRLAPEDVLRSTREQMASASLDVVDNWWDVLGSRSAEDLRNVQPHWKEFELQNLYN